MATQSDLVGEVREVVNALLKAMRARQTYEPGHSLVHKFDEELNARIALLWDRLPHLTVTVDEGRLLWDEEEVYAKEVAPDNFAFRFFKDGVRSLAFLPGVESDELSDFVSLVARARSQDDDLLALLWHRDFSAIRIEYVDVAEDESLDVPAPDRNAGAGERLDDLSEIREAVEAGASPVEEGEEFADLTLGEAEWAYLQREMKAEWNRPLVRDVTLAMLDQFEMRDQERRRQVVDVLRGFLPRVLGSRDFPNVALIVNELQLLANKTGEIETQELVTALLRDMSEAMAEIISTAERDTESPAEEEMEALLGALQAEAIPTLVRAIPSVHNSQTRQRLSDALDRLVSAHPAQITRLLSAEDPVLAAEAARIVGRLRIEDAEPMLVELASQPEQSARQAAIEALASLGSLAGARALTAALDDSSRQVRLAALAAVGRLRPEGVENVLRAHVTSADLDRRDAAERLAFFKAYAQVAGEGGVRVLDRILNGRKWWGGRRAAEVRAAAARSLGLIATPAARVALEKAASDRANAVRSAVRVALRGIEPEGQDETGGERA